MQVIEKHLKPKLRLYYSYHASPLYSRIPAISFVRPFSWSVAVIHRTHWLSSMTCCMYFVFDFFFFPLESLTPPPPPLPTQIQFAMSLIYQPPPSSPGVAVISGKPRPGIYLGGRADAKNKDRLLDRNVTHILNLTPTKEASIQAGVPNYFASLFTYHRVPIYDASTSVTLLSDQADSINRFIATALCHGSILVHCQRGVSRSAAAVLFYLMR